METESDEEDWGKFEEDEFFSPTSIAFPAESWPKFSTRDVSAFWDLKDASIFDKMSVHEIKEKFLKALAKEGYDSGLASVVVYVDEDRFSPDFEQTCLDSGFEILSPPKGREDFKFDCLLIDILWKALYRYRQKQELTNILILSDNIREDATFIKLCRTEYLNIGLADPLSFLDDDSDVGFQRPKPNTLALDFHGGDLLCA